MENQPTDTVPNNLAPHQDCNRCLLCVLSARAHSWKTASQAFWSRTCQSTKNGRDYVVRRISEGTQHFRERLPRTAEHIGSSGRRIRTWSRVVSEHTVTVSRRVRTTFTTVRSVVAARVWDARGFVVTNTSVCFLYGSTLIIFGSFLFIVLGETGFSMWLISIGGLFVWIPVFYWMNGSSDQRDSDVSLIDERSSHDQVAVEKPPAYTSLLPPTVPNCDMDLMVPPPSYEEVIRIIEGQLPSSGADCIDVTVCPVHQNTRAQRTVHLEQMVTRSRSMENLRGADRESLLALV